MPHYTGNRPGAATAPDSHFHIFGTRKREKIFGKGPGVPLDRNAKVRIEQYAKAWNARHRQDRQHKGPLTRATFEVLKALLWGFCNNRDGRCFPSYERVAATAGCARSSVALAIKALEFAGILSWANRLTKILVRDTDSLGRTVPRWQVIRTSNAYVFRDPLPCASTPPERKSENQPGPDSQEISGKEPALPNGHLAARIIVLDPENPLDAALARLGRSCGFLGKE